MSVELVSFVLDEPDDLSVLAAAFDRLSGKKIRQVAAFLRVAGEYDDGSRERARGAMQGLLQAQGLFEKAEYVTVIGCEGASTPCGFALIELGDDSSERGTPRLTIGLAQASVDEAIIGSVGFARVVGGVVERALQQGGMTSGDVQAVIVNVPQPTSGNVASRARRGRAAAALGAGATLGELDWAALTEVDIVVNDDLFTSRVQTFTGPGIDKIGVIAIGNSERAGGVLVACNTTMQNLLDAASIKRMLIDEGFTIDTNGEIESIDRIVAIIAKSGVHPNGDVIGSQTTIYSSVTPPEKHVRAAMSGVLGSVFQTTRIFGTFDPIQQAPIGGGTICCIYRAPTKLT